MQALRPPSDGPESRGLLTYVRMPKKTSKERILAHIQTNHPTTVRDVAAQVGLSSTTVYQHIKDLRDEGEVTWEWGKARTIRPCD